jgi:RNA recognition motif-containing protein
VFVGGIPFKWDDQDLRDFFMKLGNVVHAKVSCSCRRLHSVSHLSNRMFMPWSASLHAL